MNLEALFFDEARHDEALSLLASRCLIAGDAGAAFIFADRKCRSFLPGARDFLLRSEASRLAGHFEFAQGDLAKALAIDPCDPLVNERLMKWGAEAEQQSAARRLVDGDAADKTALARAVAILLAGGALSVGRLHRQQGSIVGWIAWSGARPLTLRIAREPAADFTLERTASHFLASPETSAAEIEIIDETGSITEVGAFLDGRIIFDWTPAREPMSPDAGSSIAAPIDAPAPNVSIIVPVYEDLEATKACLRALFDHDAAVTTRLLVVDDCSPNRELRAYLEHEAARRDFVLIQNEDNVGFAASVNRALRLCQTGDVLLLNADAQLPPGAIDRLFAASNAADGIGTVTPLSNNGEFTSFPEPNVANRLPSYEAIVATDRQAALANGDRVVDLPNGIGFCLYITRACLDATGPLAEIYRRGYYEDVEFCLKARERGFRNVCATGVFVGHAGAKSFREEKRALVVRNLRLLEERFPDYKRECAAFLAADPLKAARGAIESRLSIDAPIILLVSSAGMPRALARERADQTGVDEHPVYCSYSAGDRTVELKGEGGRAPQSLVFSLEREADCASLRSYLTGLKLRRIELFDFASLPEALLSLLSARGARADIVCADPQWRGCGSFTPIEGPCRSVEAGKVCEACLGEPAATAPEQTRRSNERGRAATPLDSAHAIRPLDRMAQAFAQRTFGKKVIPGAFARPAPREAGAPPPISHALAVLAPVASGLIDRQIIRICRRLAEDQSDATVVVFGRCVNDLAVMAAGNAFVAGEIEADEYRRLIVEYRITALMSPYRTCFFGLLDEVAGETGLPKAYFDWSLAALETDEENLALDARVCDEGAAATIANWLAATSHAAGAQ